MHATTLLKRLGLNKREYQVYLTGLKKGPSTAQELSTHTDISRTLTYHALDGLRKNGLVSSSGDSYGATFTMESPSALQAKIRLQRRMLKELEEAIPNISFPEHVPPTKKRSIIRHYPGIEGIRMAAIESLNVTSKQLRSLVSIRHLADTIDITFLRAWVKELKDRGIKSKSLWTQENLDPSYQSGLRTLRILPSNMQFPAGMLVYDDTVMLFTAGKSPSATFIEDAAISKMMVSLHDQLWKVSSEPKRFKQAE